MAKYRSEARAHTVMSHLRVRPRPDTFRMTKWATRSDTTPFICPGMARLVSLYSRLGWPLSGGTRPGKVRECGWREDSLGRD